MSFNTMSLVLPGLYVGNYRDSKDQQQLEKFKITHIIAIHDSPRRLLPDKHYLCVMAADTPDQNLSQYFSVCNDFIHAARLREGNVLIHCLAGMSRSVTVAVAYIMTVTSLNWKEALKVVRAGRAVANPNMGFQEQLQEFESYRLSEERRRLRERFPSTALEQNDRSKCMSALDNYEELLKNKDICEGACTRGESCPTGVQFGYLSSDYWETENDSPEGSKKTEQKVRRKRGGVSYDLSFAADRWTNFGKSKTKQKTSVCDCIDQLDSYNFCQSGGKLLMNNVTIYNPISTEPSVCYNDAELVPNVADEFRNIEKHADLFYSRWDA